MAEVCSKKRWAGRKTKVGAEGGKVAVWETIKIAETSRRLR